MMTENHYNSSNSGYFTDSFDGIGSSFTDIERLSSSASNIVARAKRYGRWWLLKGLAPEVRDLQHYRLRQRKELEILMELHHPAVVAAFGIEDVPGLGQCIVMKYAEGLTLNRWLATEPSKARRRKVALKIIEAFEYVHSRGVVHRDIKPENIIVTDNGENVRIIDFGLADTDSYAVLKQPAGTEGYISPEQREKAVADVRNDIYSLGALLRVMDAGYRRIAARCMRPADRRYRDIDELRAAMLRYQTRKKALAFIIPAIAVITGAIIAIISLSRDNERRLREMQSEASKNISALAEENDRLNQRLLRQTLRADSSEQQFSARIEEQQLIVADQQARADDARQRLDSVSRLLDAKNAHDATTTALINEGRRRMLSVWTNWEYKKHLDTLTRHSWHDNNLIYKPNDFENFPQTFVASLGQRADDEQKAAILKNLQIYQNQLYERLNDNLSQMKY